MNTPNLKLPLLDIFQSQKEVTVNQAFAILDAAYAALQASSGTGGTGGSGTPGSQFYVGQGAPDLAMGVSGDAYLDATIGDLFKKTFEGWGLPVANLRGPIGAPGETGATGVAGRDGRDGIDGAPGKDGKDGINGTSGGSSVLRFVVWEGSIGQFQVPADTTQVHVLAWGAGADGQSFNDSDTNPSVTIGGGSGAYVEAVMQVTPGETLFITSGSARGSVDLHTVVCNGANPTTNDKSDGTSNPAGTTFDGYQNVVFASSTTGAVIAGSAVGRSGGTGSVFNADGYHPVASLISSIPGQAGQLGTTVFNTTLGGSGGSAPAGGTGGSGVMLLPKPTGGGNITLSPDGGFPGGGGASVRMGGSPGRGAPGKVIIWY